jgi:hypothetical protein
VGKDGRKEQVQVKDNTEYEATGNRKERTCFPVLINGQFNQPWEKRVTLNEKQGRRIFYHFARQTREITRAYFVLSKTVLQ